MGHAFEYVKIDSSHLLMPQRRERVWGSSSTGDEPSTYAMYMKMTMQRLKSCKRFGLSHLLDDAVPSCDPPTSTNFATHLDSVRKLCKERNLCESKVALDTSTTRSRGAEWAYDMLTCVRPTHKIWLCGENRFASPQEALRSHGVFATDFKDPLTVLNLDATLALDLAGNAFSTSCLIAKILCTMVNATPWKQLAKSMPVTRPGILEECARSAGRNSMSSGSKEGSGSSGPPEEQPDSEPPKKKMKASRKSEKRKQPDGDDDPAGPGDQNTNKQSRGQNLKGSLLTIKKKMEILRKFDELKGTEKYPEKVPSMSLLYFFPLALCDSTVFSS